MDSALTRQAVTLNRPKSAGPHQPARDPMEDTDSSATRKRPRLDSGDRVYRSMSADPLRAASVDVELSDASSNPSNEETRSTIIQEVPPVGHTPSKVTINVREPVRNISPTQASTQIEDFPSIRGGGGGGDEYLNGYTESISKMVPSSPKVISVPSSPSRSPEIEVAEVEDMTNSPGETKWKSLETATNIQDAKATQAVLLEQFPHYTGQNLRKTVNLIAIALGKNDLKDSDLLTSLATWIELYLQTTDPLAPQWWDMFLDEQAFWDEFPTLVEALVQRSTTRLGTVQMEFQENGELLNDQCPLQNFLVAYTSLTLRMVRIDHQTLAEHFDEIGVSRSLISERYLIDLSHVMASDASFWNHLVDISSYDRIATVTAMMNRFVNPPEDGVTVVASLLRELLDHKQGTPLFLTKAYHQVFFINRLLEHQRTLSQRTADQSQASVTIYPRFTLQTIQIFTLVNERFQMFIGKQVSALSLEISQAFLAQLCLLLRLLVASDEHFLQKIASDKGIALEGTDKDDQALFVELAWKLDTLKRCIFDGRMEIRVQGVDTMQQDLVNIYNRFINGNPLGKDLPVPRYVSDFVLTNKLVEYLIGVESHPQLIHRSGNIIGFLHVTKRYTKAETDIIWKAVTESQDSRFVDAILAILPATFNIAAYCDLLYLTSKLNELPIHAFDGNMHRYSQQLLDGLRSTWRAERGSQQMDRPPFDLCIRLIRQAAVEQSLQIPSKRPIQQFAAAELGCFLHFGLSDIDRRSIYQECIRDISEHNDSAIGSIAAINVLLSQNPELEYPSLTQQCDLPYLITEEFAHTIEHQRQTKVTLMVSNERFDACMNLMTNIVLHVPDTISDDVGKKFWEYSVGSEALNHHTRGFAWMSLQSVIRKVAIRNSYLDRCIREYLPCLQPSCYTAGCMHFAHDVCHYHFRNTISQPPNDLKQEKTAEDLLWHMSLTALPGTIEQKAIPMLVTLFLDSPENARRTRAAIEAIHIGVVDRCVRQLTMAASKLKSFRDGTSSGDDEPMLIVASEDEIQAQQLSFSRSLAILSNFLGGIRQRPQYSPQLPTQPILYQHVHEAKGDLILVRYQVFGGRSPSEIRTIELGNLETMHDLTLRMKHLTGFSKLTMINGGQKIDLSKTSTRTLQDMNLNHKGLLLVKKDPDVEGARDLNSTAGLRPVETEVLTHFHELYPLLAMEDKFGKEMYEFLHAFPPHSTITTMVCARNTPLDDIFPPSAPYKGLYSSYTLKQCLLRKADTIPSHQDLIIHAIQFLSAALTRTNFSIGAQGTEVEVLVAVELVDCLLICLDGLTVSDELELPFTNPSALLDHLQSIIKNSLLMTENSDAQNLVSVSLAAIMTISLHSELFWLEYKETNMCSVLLKRIVLEHGNGLLRSNAEKRIETICAGLSSAPSTRGQDFLQQLWQSIAKIIPYSLEAVDTSREFFDLAFTVFQCLDYSYRKTLDLASYVDTWSGALLRHKHREFVGRETIDWVVHGLSTLLNWVLQFAKVVGKTLLIPQNLLVDLFHSHLFPEITYSHDNVADATQIPNLHSDTRQELYSIILILCNDKDNYQTLLSLVKGVIAQGEGSHACSWGFAQILEDYSYESNWTVERKKTIRSPTGYPGIRNLSNTCYMNSLFTQLFMNIKFRNFMLKTNVADAVASQKLLRETQTLFGYMQDTMLKSVDSQGIVDSLVTYDNALIDVSIQMDVDEFYNLLFDRWESQILSSTDKKRFRGFYGGQIVQQIKSKECPHISERLEPFSAIQCDIHGKPTLMDSLNAYVSGETMEGDNKYSCTSCGCYVDAVKRACFKEIPDNLIFHLKRFDYDVMTGMRSKINDAFEFPHQIDMAPYHVDYQRDTSCSGVPDMFELVGVLVHSGTAESGHYYSYIQERPPTSMSGARWIEFNDMDVTAFDPHNIADQCFGGFAEANYQRFQKNWNAYMLFYERVEPRSDSLDEIPVALDVPAKCAVPSDIGREVALSNAYYLRYYCINDPAHALFTRALLEQLLHVNMGICSEDHSTENEAICLSLDYLEQVLSRSKESSDFTKMLASLTKVIGSCAVCCRISLKWVRHHDYVLRNLLLRCPNPRVRREFASMIVLALQHLRKYEPHWYGFQNSASGDPESSSTELHTSGVFSHIVSQVAELWELLPSNIRGWDDYFGLLTDLAKLGKHETHVLLRERYLQRCLEILLVDHPSPKGFRIRNEHPHYLQFCRLVEKGRKFSFNKLIELLAVLLEKIDLTMGSLRRPQDRRFDPRGMPLTVKEDELMQYGTDEGRSRNCAFLEKILNTRGSSQATQATQRIVRTMTLDEPQFGVLDNIQATITGGVNIEPADDAEPFLKAAITFCEATPTTASAQTVIRSVAAEVDTIGRHGGEEHLRFFAQARRLVNLRNGFEPGFFSRCVLRAIPQWAPALLYFHEENVRNSTVELLRILVFDHDLNTMDDEEHADLIETAAKDLQLACTRRCKGIVQLQQPIKGKSVEQLMSVIRYCVSHYYTDEDQRIIMEAENVLTALKVLTISDADDVASDACFNGSSDIPTDSDDEFLTTSP